VTRLLDQISPLLEYVSSRQLDTILISHLSQTSADSYCSVCFTSASSDLQYDGIRCNQYRTNSYVVKELVIKQSWAVQTMEVAICLPIPGLSDIICSPFTFNVINIVRVEQAYLRWSPLMIGQQPIRASTHTETRSFQCYIKCILWLGNRGIAI